MLSRVVISIIVGIITAFLFYLIGTLILPFATTIGQILINVSYAAGIIAGILWFFNKTAIV